MAETTTDLDEKSRIVADVLGGELREKPDGDTVRREVVVEFPESVWDDVTDADVDELILEPVEQES